MVKWVRRRVRTEVVSVDPPTTEGADKLFDECLAKLPEMKRDSVGHPNGFWILDEHGNHVKEWIDPT